MYSYFLVLIACIAFTVQAQDSCPQKFSAFKSCIVKEIEAGRAQARPRFTAIKNQLNDCFRKAKCTNPLDEDPDEVECKKQFRTETRKRIESCVKAEYPQFSFPQRPEDIKHIQEEPLLKTLDSACKDGGDKQKAQFCLQNIYDKNSPTEAETRSKFEAVCAKIKRCKNELTGCETSVRGIKSKLCRCSREVHGDAAAIRAGLDHCSVVSQEVQERQNDPSPDCDDIELYKCERGFDAFKRALLNRS